MASDFAASPALWVLGHRRRSRVRLPRHDFLADGVSGHSSGDLSERGLGTEWGAELDCFACSPDQKVVGSAGYSPETLAYVSELAMLSHRDAVGYTFWNAGDWNDSPAGITGALDTFGSCPPMNGAGLPCLPLPTSSPAGLH